jgi:hypothetical protein
MARPEASFLAFFLAWASLKGWAVPEIHVRACHWLEHRGDLAVLRIFRGAGKSTILAVYNAWRFWKDPAYRILHQGDQDRTAYKTSRDTQAVLRRHPWTAQWALGIRGESAFWWAPEADDERNPSMQAAGITSNITSSRCDEAQNDDVEVPRNIQNPEAREKMRYRLGEQVHIMVPGARRLFVGTPHTHDSIYDEQERMGADCLTIRMFAQECRIDSATANRYEVPFDPEVVFAGIGAGARWLRRGADWQYRDGRIVFAAPPGALVDAYSGCAWPERFTHKELFTRRKQTRTINEWDSQYQLHSRPTHEVRLNPEKIRRYDVEPVLRYANKEAALWLGRAQIVSATCRWDPAGGKTHSDVSALAVVLSDEYGNRYWHRAIPLLGDVAEFSDDGKTITGGQVLQIVGVVKNLGLRRVTVESNGVGTFAPTVLMAALKQAKVTDCGVAAVHTSQNKNSAILEAFDGPLSSGKLWAHASVLDGPAWAQMRDWNPEVRDQPDDYMDAAAKALADTPERIGRIAPQAAQGAGWNPPRDGRDDWRPSAGVHEVELEN